MQATPAPASAKKKPSDLVEGDVALADPAEPAEMDEGELVESAIGAKAPPRAWNP